MTVSSSPSPFRRLKKNIAPVAFIIAIIMGTAAFMNTFIVDSHKARSEKLAEDVKSLEKQNNELNDKLKIASVQNSESKGSGSLDLSTFSMYRTAYDFSTKNAASGLILSEEAREKLKNNPIENIEVTVGFGENQDSVKLWLMDMRGNNVTRLLTKFEGKRASSDRKDEFKFKIPVSALEKVDPASISEISFEATNLKVPKGYFVIKSLVMK